jgi:DNA-binding MarR family transcriptional regulator
MSTEPNGDAPEFTMGPDSDYVDSLMASWREERSVEEVDLMGLSTRLARISSYHDKLAVRHARVVGLSRIETYILGALRSAGSPYQLAAGEISARMLSNSRNISVPLRHLEEKGFIQRDFHPDDRRSVIVSLTFKGSDAYNDVRAGNREIFAGLSVSEQRALSVLLRKALVSLGDTPAGLRESWTRQPVTQDVV